MSDLLEERVKLLEDILRDVQNHPGAHSLGLRLRNIIGVALGDLEETESGVERIIVVKPTSNPPETIKNITSGLHPPGKHAWRSTSGSHRCDICYKGPKEHES